MADDTLTAAPSAASGAPASPTTAPSIESAGDSLRAAGSWADFGIPSVADMAVTDGEETGADDTTSATPVDAAETAEAGADAPEFVQNAQGQWHRPDGTFANAEEIAQITAQLASDAAAAPEAEAPQAETVSIRRRDGTMREVVIDDPELAQEIRQNVNDGMRKREYTEKVTALDAKLAEFRQLETMLQTNPEAIILDSLTPEQEVRVTQALVAKHFDVLLPILQKYDTDPSSRIAATAEAQLRMREQQQVFEQTRSASQQAAAVKNVVDTLIPETIPDDVARSFWTDASNDLQGALARGELVDPTTVPALLAYRMKLYGFELPAGATPAAVKARITAVPSTASTPGGSPVAAPANAAAKAMADVKATQTRIRLTQRNRANAAAVPPVGAGAAPVRLPPVPKGASIEEASAAMRKMRSWTS